MPAFDGGGSCVVSGKGKQNLIRPVLIEGEQLPEVGGAAFRVLTRIARVNTEVARGGRHELHQAESAFGRNGVGAEARFRAHHAADERLWQRELLGCGRSHLDRRDGNGLLGDGERGGRSGRQGDRGIRLETGDEAHGHFGDARSVIEANDAVSSLVTVCVQPVASAQHDALARLGGKNRQRQKKGASPDKMDQAVHDQ